MNRSTLLILTFMLGNALSASVPVPIPAPEEPLVVSTAGQHPAVILYDGRLPDVYSTRVENLESVRPFFGNVEDFLCKIEQLDNVRIIINIASKLTPSIIFDNSTVAETRLVTISINRGLFTNFTTRQLEVALALIIATYSPARKGQNGFDMSPIALAQNMPTSIVAEIISGVAAIAFAGLGFYKKEWLWQCLGLSGLCGGSIYFADRVRRNTIVHIPQIIFKQARSMLSEITRKDLAKNPDHYLQTIALLAQVVSHSVQENFFIEDIFTRAFYKFSILAQEEPSAPQARTPIKVITP